MSFKTLCVTLLLVATISQVHSCPDGWTGHNGMCFKYMREAYSWFNAQYVCHASGGFLAEDTSAEVHAFLKGMVISKGHSAWIGGQDFLEEGLFVWATSRQAITTTYWSHGQPDNSHGHQDCMGMSSVGWYDGSCQDDSHPAICQLSLSTEEPVIG